MDCLCDSTFNFPLVHNREKLDPTWKISHNDIHLESWWNLKNRGDVCINGDIGHKLSSNMGID